MEAEPLMVALLLLRMEGIRGTAYVERVSVLMDLGW